MERDPVKPWEIGCLIAVLLMKCYACSSERKPAAHHRSPVESAADFLRKAQAERRKTATTPTWSWSVTWGIFQDDVILTNTSSFPLTNVTIKPAITIGGVVNTPALAPIAELKPGASYTWSNCMSLDKDKMTLTAATLVCDQVVP